MSQNTLLSRVCAPIDWRHGNRFDPEGSKKGLAIAEQHFADNQLGLLDFLVTLLAHYGRLSSRYMAQPAVLSCGLIARRATAIINSMVGDPDKQVKLNIKMAKSCIDAQHPDTAESLLRAATAIQGVSRSSAIALLEARRQLHMEHNYRELPGVLQQLIGSNEENGAVDHANRRAVAELFSRDERFADARSVLEPLLTSCPDDAELLALVGVTYVKEGKYAEARPLLERAQKQDHRIAAHELAETYFQLGDLVAAAPIFRALAESYRDEVENNYR